MKKCIFPFKFGNNLFEGCTQTENNGMYWCPTQLSKDGSLYMNSSNWGICESNCPIDGKVI